MSRIMISHWHSRIAFSSIRRISLSLVSMSRNSAYFPNWACGFSMDEYENDLTLYHACTRSYFSSSGRSGRSGIGRDPEDRIGLYRRLVQRRCGSHGAGITSRPGETDCEYGSQRWMEHAGTTERNGPGAGDTSGWREKARVAAPGGCNDPGSFSERRDGKDRRKRLGRLPPGRKVQRPMEDH